MMLPVVEYIDANSGAILEIDETEVGFEFFSNNCVVPVNDIPSLIKSLQIAYTMRKLKLLKENNGTHD